MKTNYFSNSIFALIFFMALFAFSSCSNDGNTPIAKYYNVGILATDFYNAQYLEMQSQEQEALLTAKKNSVLAGENQMLISEKSGIDFTLRMKQITLVNVYFNKMFMSKELTKSKNSTLVTESAINVLEAMKSMDTDTTKINQVIESLGSQKVDFEEITAEIMKILNKYLKLDADKYAAFVNQINNRSKAYISEIKADALDFEKVKAQLDEPISNDAMALEMYKLNLMNKSESWKTKVMQNHYNMNFVMDRMLVIIENFSDMKMDKTFIVKNIELLKNRLDPIQKENKK